MKRLFTAILVLVLLLALAPAVQSSEFVTGTITAVNGAVTIRAADTSAIGVRVSGTWVATLAFEGSVDGSAFFGMRAYPFPLGSGVGIATTTANGQWVVLSSGLSALRVTATAFTSGTVTVNLASSVAALGTPDIIPVPRNSTGNAVNAAVTATITGIVNQQVRINHVGATCSAGTATLIVQDAGVTVLSYVAAASHTVAPGGLGVLIAAGATATVQLAACGVGNTGTLNVAAVQF